MPDRGERSGSDGSTRRTEFKFKYQHQRRSCPSSFSNAFFKLSYDLVLLKAVFNFHFNKIPSCVGENKVPRE